MHFHRCGMVRIRSCWDRKDLGVDTLRNCGLWHLKAMKHGDIKWNRQWDKQTLVQLLTDCYGKAKTPFTLNIFPMAIHYRDKTMQCFLFCRVSSKSCHALSFSPKNLEKWICCVCLVLCMFSLLCCLSTWLNEFNLTWEWRSRFIHSLGAGCKSPGPGIGDSRVIH